MSSAFRPKLGQIGTSTPNIVNFTSQPEQLPMCENGILCTFNVWIALEVTDVVLLYLYHVICMHNSTY